MPIQSNASPDEKNSPFYQANKDLCEKWEHFVLEKNGKFNAVYNAWSFDIKSKFKTKKTWLISVKKATYSNGSIYFSSKKQNLLEILEFQTRFDDSRCKNFCITRSILKRRTTKHPLYDASLKLFSGKKYDYVKFKDGLLTLRYAHRNDDFELVKSVLDEFDSLA